MTDPIFIIPEMKRATNSNLCIALFNSEILTFVGVDLCHSENTGIKTSNVAQ